MKNFEQRLQQLEEQWQEPGPEADPLPPEEDEEARIAWALRRLLAQQSDPARAPSSKEPHPYLVLSNIIRKRPISREGRSSPWPGLAVSDSTKG
jgi:hypothetical protein